MAAVGKDLLSSWSCILGCEEEVVGWCVAVGGGRGLEVLWLGLSWSPDVEGLGLAVDPPCATIRTNEVPTQAGPDFVEDPVPVGLGHLGVALVAGVAPLCALLGQPLPLLLTFLDECIVLGSALQPLLIPPVNFVRVLPVLPPGSLDSEWEGGRVERNLPAGRWV